MSDKIGWVDNLRAVACLMVVMIHATTWYITSGGAPGSGQLYWEVANVLNSASRVCVPLFFMISGYLFFGERQAQKKHFIRIGLCIVFYSLAALIYIALLTPINALNALRYILQKPVFYHLWFFYAIAVIYLLSPLVRVRPVAGRALLLPMVVLALIANPNTSEASFGGVKLLPVNLYIYGDTFYYLLYAVLGRALGMLEFRHRATGALAAGLFIVCVILIALGTRHQTLVNGDFAQTFYIYCGPLVFFAAVSLLVLFKYYLNRRPLPGLALIARHSLAIYGLHALIIHFIRTHGLSITAHPVLDIFYVFALALAGSLLLSLGLQRLDTRRLVC
ncbi:acyltransferase [Affinibrenneria salicis]|uniref:O-acetyltransferase WecH n=1 Tax=Affinibrenneria salicis TaxID=2590031 RepID=A0A5J5FVA9_9GAMM|nr:acyltransferase [Affinibrenneria salicis]KAA8997347.1 acyltransferase [Affinibrenneria salicis]